MKQVVVYPRSSDDPLWYQPTTVSDVFSTMKAHSDVNVKVICGDTGKGTTVLVLSNVSFSQGVFKDMSEDVQVYIDLKCISELQVIEVSPESNNS